MFLFFFMFYFYFQNLYFFLCFRFSIWYIHHHHQTYLPKKTLVLGHGLGLLPSPSSRPKNPVNLGTFILIF